MKKKKIFIIIFLLIILSSNFCFATDTNIITANEIYNNEITISDINNNIHTTNFILVVILLFIFISYILRLKK